MSTDRPRARAVRLGESVLALGLVLLSGAIAAAQTARSAPRHAPDSILVRFKATAPPAERAQAHALAGASVHRSFTLVEGLQVVRVPRGMTVKDAIERYQRHPAVLYAEPNWIVHHQASPNDPGFANMWGLNNTGQSGGLPDADIDAVEAWNLTTGSAGVVVAVIDTGIDPNHEDLTANLFRNTADCNSNGVDDDGNGQIDDCFGINTAANTSNPLDDNGHGTHVAGTIGAAGNNGVGVDTLPAGTPIKAAHFTELLAAINAVQPGTNLSWPSPAPVVGGTVLAVHLQTLRQPLSLAPVGAGAVISAQHINEIRLKIRSLE